MHHFFSRKMFDMYTNWNLIMFAICFFYSKTYLVYYSSFFVFLLGQLFAAHIYNKHGDLESLMVVTFIHMLYLLPKKPLSANEIKNSIYFFILSLLLYILYVGPSKIYEIYVIKGVRNYLSN